MNTRLRPIRRTAAALLILIGLFLLGVLLTPAPPPVQALNAPAPAATPPVSAAVKIVGAYAALSVQIPPIHIPAFLR